jgi:hypothetical protein
MVIPDEFRKCVAFLGYQVADKSFRMAGTAFWIVRDLGEGKFATYMITARHVIDGIRSLGLTEVAIRMNKKSGDAEWLKTKIDDWFSHPTDKSIDVAIHSGGNPSQDHDHRILPLTICATAEKLLQNEVGLGDEVFITGLFRHHYGNKRNIPIIRIGNIACLDEGKISTSKYGDIDAYLIECRSIGGLSGSPVFINLGAIRYIGGQIQHAQGGPMLLLIGLVHGHFDSKTSSVDESRDDKNDLLTPERVNTGIAIVVPVQRIQETIALFDKSSKLASS